jgi:hypothetical protein
MKAVSLFLLLVSSNIVHAGRISGLITDEKNNILPFASILIKGSSRGTTANQQGRYFLQVEPGEYTVICQYVGYERQEKSITVTNDAVLDFHLKLQETSMKEFIVKPGGEDPAYEIIRSAIKKRSYHLNEIENFQCEVYVKGVLKLRDFPDKLFGKSIDLGEANGMDTGKQQTIYLSESIATYSFQKPNKSKVEVSSTKVSGQRDGFGMSQPQIISFYENNILLFPNLNPRGFVSPIADNALNFYRYKLLGVFFEEGREINKIQVTAKRKFEPLFNGIINITENDWHIHSVQLDLTRESQMDILDTLKVQQLYVPYQNNLWVIKHHVIYPSIKIFGIDSYGSIVNNYSDFNTSPTFAPNFFNRTVLKFQDSSNKRSMVYWDSVRPIPLQPDEVADYKRKDSLEKVMSSPVYLDSMDRKRNRFKFSDLLFTGQTFTKRSKRETYSFISLVDALNFNTAEGIVVNFSGTYSKRLDTVAARNKFLRITPTIRYGFSNHHLNGSLSGAYNYGKRNVSMISAGGGKHVFQFNNENPIRPRDNTLTTLLLEKNLMKTYEAWFGGVGWGMNIGMGISLGASLSYQDRMPLENTSDFTLREREKRQYTPNYPSEIVSSNIQRHQAFSSSISVSWQPGGRYIEFPDRKVSIGSKYPRFNLQYIKGFKDLLGSDVDYDKWRFVVGDGLNMKLAGKLDYRFSVGGFLNRNKVQLPDYQHFRGNQVVFASAYVSSFQLAPYYLNSTTARLYSTLNVEYHLNGLLTNKLPVIRKLNWQLVTGSNAFYVNSANNYVEAFVGFENIFRVLRVDFIQSYSAGRKPHSGITIGLQGAIFGN